MYELIRAGENTYYIKCPAVIGVYKINEKDVYIIDSGNDKEAGRKVFSILQKNNWTLRGIINTHSNADHAGGNQYLQEKTGCEIISSNIENVFIEYPYLESSFLYGGFPCKDLRNKFLLAKPSHPTTEISNYLPEGIEYFKLGGHFFNMIGLKTSDDVYFLADSLFSENIINKYHIFFIYDVKEFLNTLNFLEELKGNLFIPSHAEATTDIKALIEINRNKVYEIINELSRICSTKIIFEDILKAIFDFYNLNMDFNQYVLVGSTIRSYLSYMYDEGKIRCVFENNKLYWTV